VRNNKKKRGNAGKLDRPGTVLILQKEARGRPAGVREEDEQQQSRAEQSCTYFTLQNNKKELILIVPYRSAAQRRTQQRQKGNRANKPAGERQEGAIGDD
jgi:hypothetical protein